MADGTARDVRLEPVAVHARALLAALGVDTTTPGTQGTAGRWARALVELTSGLHTDPGAHLDTQFPAEASDPGMIVVTGVEFASLCEHHMLPFTGRAAVGYLPKPGAAIVGLSKLARLVLGLAAKPQVQERLGEQVVQSITDRLQVEGAGCVIRASHSCMGVRGVRCNTAEMVTSHIVGRFRDDLAVRQEFLALAMIR